MKRIAVIIIFLIIASCRTPNFGGVYSSYQSPYSFTLKADSTYTFNYQEGILYKHSFGRWHAKKKGIIFQSFFRNRIIPLSGIDISTDELKESINLSIHIPIPEDRRAYYRCLIYLNDRFFVEKSCDSIADLKIPATVKNVLLKLTADSHIPGIVGDTLTSSHYYTNGNKLKAISLNLFYNDSLFNYQVFNSYTIKSSGRSLNYMKFKLFKDIKHQE
jgi:hypothetical protein